MIAASVLAGLSFSSCSLKEDTQGLSSPDHFFRKYSECQSVVNGCYIPVKNIYTYTYMIATECVTDLAYIPSGTKDAQLDIAPAIPRYGSTVWKQGYAGVQRCNFAVNGIERAHENGSIDDTQYNELICEAKVLRAFYYYTLTCFFGNVPFYFDDVTDNEVLKKIQVLPRMDAVETRDKLIADLQTVAPNATQTRTCDNEGNRLGAACAYMLIGKMAMWNKEWDVALDALGHIEDIYGSLSFYDYVENAMFRNKNTPESIFEIQHEYVEGGISYTSNVAAICQPYARKAGTDIYDGVSIPELGDRATVWTAMRANFYLSQGLLQMRSKDIRAKINLAWDYNGTTFKNGGSRPWCGPKFWCPRMLDTKDSNNYKVFRFADALLMMSECYFYKGDYETALTYLNYTRERAHIGKYVFRTPVRLEEEIRNERARELFGEFQRKFDLVRWGIWYEAVTGNTDYATLKEDNPNSLIKPCHEYYPIPDTEIAYSKYALDNKEYAKYGL